MEFKKFVCLCSSLISKLTCRAHNNDTDGRSFFIMVIRGQFGDNFNGWKLNIKQW
jgi:hypothetical protein